MKLVIAEKPSVAGDIAKYLGARERGDGFFKGNDYCVTWAYGHLIEIADFKYQGYGEQWRLDNLPFIPNVLKKGPKNDPGAKKQLAAIKSLMESASEVVCATDAGREGELIFRYIYSFCGVKIPIKRLWISSLTDDAIRDGFSNLQPGDNFLSLYHAAVCRNEADYIVGINATIAATVKSNTGLLISLGRVQTPTLALVCQRYLDHTEFVKTPYFEAQFNFIKNNFEFKGQTQNKYSTAAAAQSIIQHSSNTGKVVNVDQKNTKEKAPKLFDLTQLQRYANTKLGFTAQKTLDVMQSLYEKHKILTYPRTDSQYLSSDMKDTIPTVFNSLLHLNIGSESIKNILSKELSSVNFNNEKVTDHHAIIPTNKKADLQSLSKDELAIYTFVVKRFIEAFGDPCEKLVTKITIDMGSVPVVVTGIEIKLYGWRAVSKDDKKELDDENLSEDNQVLPPIVVGEEIQVNKKLLLERMTSPPPLLNESSLLQLMATAGKLIEDEELSEAIKETGIGRTATRAGIIETLVNRKFIERKGKTLIPSANGLALYMQVRDLSISKVELTGQWEQKLVLIEKGQYSNERFKSEINNYISLIVEEIKTFDFLGIERKNMGTCPKCKKGTLNQTQKSYSCSEYKEGCDFTIWLTVNGKKITDKNVNELLSNGKTSLISGFNSKEGKKYDGYIVLDPTTFKMGIKVPTDDDPENVKCPKCSVGVVKNSEKNIYCSKYKEGCTFSVWKTISGKKITDAQILKLITTGSTPLIKGFMSKADKPFDAKLKLTNEFKVEFVFEKK